MPKNIIKADLTSRLDPYEDLANAIVAQAIMDYRELRAGNIVGWSRYAQSRLKPEKKMEIIAAKKAELIKFLRSRYFGILTNLSPDYLIQKLESEPIRRSKTESEAAYGRK